MVWGYRLFRTRLPMPPHQLAMMWAVAGVVFMLLGVVDLAHYFRR
jgi:hypothetical protein